MNRLHQDISNLLKPLKHGNRVRRVRRPRLRHIPMLNNAGPIHAVDIRQRNWLWLLIDPDMDQADVAVEVVAQHIEGGVREDAVELGFVGGAALGVEGIVLDEVDGDIGFEGQGGVLESVEVVDEVEEELALLGFGGGLGGAVRWGGDVAAVVRCWVRSAGCEREGGG